MGRKLPYFLDDDAPEQLLEATTRQRDRLIVMCLLCLGLRVSELCRLAVEDLDFRRRSLFVRQGKGAKDRLLPIPRVLLGPLRGWVGRRRTGPVFLSPYQNGRGLAVRTVQLLIKRLAVAAGLPEAQTPRRVSPHKLRHAMASRLVAAGVSIYDVKELLGHSSIAVTEVYLHTSPERLEAAINAVYD